jgi:hypothetical protein
MPAAEWDSGVAAWKRRLRATKRRSAATSAQEIGKKVVKNRAAMVKAIEKEDREHAADERAREGARRRRLSDARRRQIATREREVSLKKREAKLAASEVFVELLKERKKKAELEIIVMKEKQEAKNVNVVVQDQGPMDLVRDVQWVYENLADLVLVSENGVRQLDIELLSQAPSNGAIAIAQYARDKPDAFLERFVLRCMPKEQNTVEDESDGDREERLDPTFKGLAKYFGGGNGN